jgi:hypothetical protein
MIRDNDLGDFVETFAKAKGIVEEFVPNADKVPWPSGQAKILTDGRVRILSTHDQRLSPGGGYIGAVYPAATSYRKAIADMTRRVTGFMAGLGVRGRLGIDAVATPGSLRPVETNLRSGGTTHTQIFAGLATQSSLDDDGQLAFSGGRPVVYRAAEHAHEMRLSNMPPKVFVEALTGALRKKGLLFDAHKKTGVRLHLIDTLPNVAYTIVATSAREAVLMEKEFLKTLRSLAIRYGQHLV